MSYKKLATGFVLVLMMWYLPPKIAFAQASEAPSQSALAVSPAIIEEAVTPGAQTVFSVEVRNVTNLPLPIKTFVSGLVAQEHTTELPQHEQARLDASQWFVVAEPEFILQPYQARTVTGTIRPPLDATPGGHYATVFFQPLVPTDVLHQSSAYLSARVGVLSFLVVKGEVEEQAELATGLQTQPIVERGPINLNFSIHNSGNVHLLPAGTVSIADLSGKHVTDLTVPPGIVLPNSSRTYSLEWDEATMGKYTAELTLEYGANKIQLPKTSVTFWVLPWISVLVGMICTALVLFFIIKTRHRWSKAWRALREK